MKKIFKLPKQIFAFFGNVRQEMKLVEFPTRKENIKMTSTVLTISILFTLLLLSLDLIFSSLRNYITQL